MTATLAEAGAAMPHYDRPWHFYGLATATSFAFFLLAAWLSHLPTRSAPMEWLVAGVGLAGLAAPAGVALVMLRAAPVLGADVRRRLLLAPGTRWRHLFLAATLMPARTVVAIALSLPWGYGMEQFQLRDGYSFSSSVLPVWLILALAPILEEFAWHSWGTDALVARMNLLAASLIFTVFWALWHLPLAAIKGYYHADIATSGWWHALNFPLSLVPFVLLMNWLYYRSGRSIAVAVVFHGAANFANEIFSIDADAKLIQTALLGALAVLVVWRERALFLGRLAPAALPAVG